MNVQSSPAILSPCVGICELDTEGYCKGCLRSGDEIARWVAMDDAERQQVIEHVLTLRAKTFA